MPFDSPPKPLILAPAPKTLRQALGLPEPDFGPQYRNPAYHGGYRSREDQEDALAFEAKWKREEGQ